jgi:esterase
MDYAEAMRRAAAAAGVVPRRFAVPTDSWATVNGVRLHYLDWGNPQLPPVLLLHGIRLQAHTWDMAALLLHDDYHLIAPDQRGHGDSDWTPDAQAQTDTIALLLEDLVQLVQHLGWQKFVLVGMSLGGIVAMHYASRFAERLQALVLIDIAPTVEQGGVLSMNGFKQDTSGAANFEEFVERAHRFMPQRPVEQLRYSLMHSLKSQPHGFSWKHDPRPQLTSGAPLAELWQALPRIVAPTLLLRGAQSAVLSQQVAERAVRTLPNGTLAVVDPANHNVHSDNPKAFALELHTFLKRVL